MNSSLPRRDFLKIVPAAAGLLSQSVRHQSATAPAKRPDLTLSGARYTPRADYPIQPVRFSGVTMRDAFWKPKIDTNASVTIPFELRKFAETGRPINHNVLEAAIDSLQTHPDAALQARVDARIAELRESADANPSSGNGLFEVAAAHYFATGRRDLLDAAIASADRLYDIQQRDAPPFSGGERDAINCLQLFRATHEKKYLDLAKYYLDIRGLENSVNRSRHNQSYKPVLEQTEAVGHAVNGATLMVSLADVGVLTGIPDYFETARRLWLDAAGRKMYITGGIGSSGNEGFGEAYVLPNISAYAETCAALMFTTFNHRMFLATGDGKYVDVMERTMYNNAVDGVSAEGNRFFYVNRLSSAGDGRDTRWERASLECCPPNLVRFLASMPRYIYAQGPNAEVYVNLYVSSEASFAIAGRTLTLSVDSEMPWGGRSTITVKSESAVDGTIKLRIPGWARNQPVPGTLYTYAGAAGAPTTISVNGTRVSQPVDASGYVSLRRSWNHGDTVEIAFPFDVRKVIADRRIKEDKGKMAVERGPIVYCAEWPECDGGRALELLFDANDPFTPFVHESLPGRVVALRGAARPIGNPPAPPGSVTLIPYYLWANRGPGEMTVWLPTAEYAPGDVGPAGGFIFHVNPNFAADGWRYLEAAPFDQSAGAPWGCFRTAVPGARGTAVGTGRQNTLDMLAACPAPGTAAQLCSTYRLNGVGGWFLPSRDELVLMYRNLKATGACDFRDAGIADNYCYWASSQQTADMAAHVDFADNGRLHGDDKDFPRRVRAIRMF